MTLYYGQCEKLGKSTVIYWVKYQLPAALDPCANIYRVPFIRFSNCGEFILPKEEFI